MAEVDWSTETVASRVTVPKAELPNSEIRAKPIHSKSAFNFLAKIRSGLMAYLMECLIGLGELHCAHTGNYSRMVNSVVYGLSPRLLSRLFKVGADLTLEMKRGRHANAPQKN
jgi:hypothetical protein